MNIDKENNNILDKETINSLLKSEDDIENSRTRFLIKNKICLNTYRR